MNLPGTEQPIRWERNGNRVIAHVGKEPSLADMGAWTSATYYGCPCCGRSYNNPFSYNALQYQGTGLHCGPGLLGGVFIPGVL